MPQVFSNRVTVEERDRLLCNAWLSQNEFARIIEVTPQTLTVQLSRGKYKDLYTKIGASRKFNSTKVKRFLGM